MFLLDGFLPGLSRSPAAPGPQCPLTLGRGRGCCSSPTMPSFPTQGSLPQHVSRPSWGDLGWSWVVTGICLSRALDILWPFLYLWHWAYAPTPSLDPLDYSGDSSEAICVSCFLTGDCCKGSLQMFSVQHFTAHATPHGWFLRQSGGRNLYQGISFQGWLRTRVPQLQGHIILTFLGSGVEPGSLSAASTASREMLNKEKAGSMWLQAVWLYKHRVRTWCQ